MEWGNGAGLTRILQRLRGRTNASRKYREYYHRYLADSRGVCWMSSIRSWANAPPERAFGTLMATNTSILRWDLVCSFSGTVLLLSKKPCCARSRPDFTSAHRPDLRES